MQQLSCLLLANLAAAQFTCMDFPGSVDVGANMPGTGGTAESAWNALTLGGGVGEGAVEGCAGATYNKKTSSCNSANPQTIQFTETAGAGGYLFAFSGSCPTGGGGSAPGGCMDTNICIGGYVDTQTYTLGVNDVVHYDYTAESGGDWFEVAAVLVDASNGNQVYAKFKRGSTGRFTESLYTITSAGDYFVRFFLGSYDRSGGGGLGARLTVHSFSAAQPDPATCTRSPTRNPTQPTTSPTLTPSSSAPTDHPSTSAPTDHPATSAPTDHPSTSAPTDHPSTSAPTDHPSTSAPSRHPTTSPTTSAPSRHPTTSPTTSAPSRHPTTSPTTSAPSRHPTTSPTTSDPSRHPTTSPTTSPSRYPTTSPSTSDPSRHPTTSPSTSDPSRHPTTSPRTSAPSRHPTISPIVLTKAVIETALQQAVSNSEVVVSDRQIVAFEVLETATGNAPSETAFPAPPALEGETDVTLGLPRKQVRVTLTGSLEGWNDGGSDDDDIKTWLAAQLNIDKARIRLLAVTGGSLIIDFEVFEVPITSAPTSDGGTSFPTTAAPVPVPPIIRQTEEDTKPWIIAVAVAVGVGIVGLFFVVFYCTREEKKEVTAADVEKGEAEQMQEEAAGRKKAEGGDVEAQPSPCGDGEMTEPCKGEDGGVGRLRIRVDSLTCPGAMSTLPYGNELPSGTPGMSTEPHSRTSNEPYGPDRSDD